MKFLVTGSIRSSRGPRFIVLSSSFIFVLFLALRFLSEILSGRFFPDAPVDEPLTSLLERAHADLFFNGVLFLFFASVLREMLSVKRQKLLLPLLFSASFFPPVFSVLVCSSSECSNSYPVFFLAFVFVYAAAAILVFYRGLKKR